MMDAMVQSCVECERPDDLFTRWVDSIGVNVVAESFYCILCF